LRLPQLAASLRLLLIRHSYLGAAPAASQEDGLEGEVVVGTWVGGGGYVRVSSKRNGIKGGSGRPWSGTDLVRRMEGGVGCGMKSAYKKEG
jgi:hypothetical protein